MTVPSTESGEGDPGQVTRIAEEFIRLHEAGQLADLDQFCGGYPEDQRDQVRQFLMTNNVEANPPISPSIDTFMVTYRFEQVR